MAIKTIVVGLLSCSVAALAWHYTRKPAPVFQTAAVERGDMQSIVVSTGTIGPLVTVQVGSQVSGIVSKLYADFNSSVHKGQLLAEIDPAPFVAKLNQAKASLDAAKAAVDAAKASVEKAASDIQSAQQQQVSQKSQMDLAVSAENLAKIQSDRAALSAKAEVGTVSDQAAAEAALEVAADSEAVAAAQSDAAAVSIKVDQEAYETAVNQVTTAVAQVRQQEGVVEQAQLDLDHTKILSPTEGVVLSRDVDLGQTVAASFAAPTLFEIAQDLTKMQVDADMDQADISKIQVGEPATFKVDALPNITFQTSVVQIRENPINVNNVITYDVIMSVANPNLQLFPGMTANIRLQTAKRTNVLKVPTTALRYLPAGVAPQKNVQTVYTLAAEKPVAHPIKTGITDGRFVELVTGDLQEGDALVVSETHPK